MLTLITWALAGLVLGGIVFYCLVAAAAIRHGRGSSPSAGCLPSVSILKPLFGVDWTQYWDMPLHEVRKRFSISTVPGVGKGILADHDLPTAA